MQTSEFGKSKGFWKTLSEGTWSEAYDGLAISILLTTNPSIQVSFLVCIYTNETQRNCFSRLGFSSGLPNSDKDFFPRQYTAYDQLKERILKSKISNRTGTKSSPEALSAFSAFMLGAVSKCAATCLTYPAIRWMINLNYFPSPKVCYVTSVIDSGNIMQMKKKKINFILCRSTVFS